MIFRKLIVQCRHPVGPGVIDQPMSGDALQCIEPGIDHLNSKMSGTTCSTGVADQMARLDFL